MLHWMFNCRHVTQKVSESMDRKLPLHERILIRMHQLMCKYCYRFEKHLLLLRVFSRSRGMMDSTVDPSVELSTPARERIKHTLSTYRH